MRERRSSGVGDGERREESQGRRQSGGSTSGSGGEVVEERCQQHGERLLLYCLEDQQLLCVVCQTARRHREHQLCPVEEVAEDLKVGWLNFTRNDDPAGYDLRSVAFTCLASN